MRTPLTSKILPSLPHERVLVALLKPLPLGPADDKFGHVVAFRVSDLVLVPLKAPTGEIRKIPLVS